MSRIVKQRLDNKIRDLRRSIRIMANQDLDNPEDIISFNESSQWNNPISSVQNNGRIIDVSSDSGSDSEILCLTKGYEKPEIITEKIKRRANKQRENKERDNNNSIFECIICTDKYEEFERKGKFMTNLKCGHTFCNRCAYKALIRGKCFLCQQEIKGKSEIRKIIL